MTSLMRSLLALTLALTLAQGIYGFSVYSDLYSNPKFSIEFSNRVYGPDALTDLPESQFQPIIVQGQKYVCELPQNVTQAATNHSRHALDSAGSESAVVERARGLLDNPSYNCVYSLKGYWMYEVCYGREIRQFHPGPLSEPGAVPEPQPNTPVYSLGKFEESGELTVQANGELAAYAVETLTGGSTCDLTGKDRSIEVRYYCREGSEFDKIEWIKELKTCHYGVAIYTPRLCKELAFVPPKDQNINIITCSRVLDTNEAEDGSVTARFTGDDRSVELKRPRIGHEREFEGIDIASIERENDLNRPAIGQSVVQIDYEMGTVLLSHETVDDDLLGDVAETIISAFARDLATGIIELDGVVFRPDQTFTMPMSLVGANQNFIADIEVEVDKGKIVITIPIDDEDVEGEGARGKEVEPSEEDQRQDEKWDSEELRENGDESVTRRDAVSTGPRGHSYDSIEPVRQPTPDQSQTSVEPARSTLSDEVESPVVHEDL